MINTFSFALMNTQAIVEGVKCNSNCADRLLDLLWGRGMNGGKDGLKNTTHLVAPVVAHSDSVFALEAFV